MGLALRRGHLDVHDAHAGRRGRGANGHPARSSAENPGPGLWIRHDLRGGSRPRHGLHDRATGRILDHPLYGISHRACSAGAGCWATGDARGIGLVFLVSGIVSVGAGPGRPVHALLPQALARLCRAPDNRNGTSPGNPGQGNQAAIAAELPGRRQGDPTGVGASRRPASSPEGAPGNARKSGRGQRPYGSASVRRRRTEMYIRYQIFTCKYVFHITYRRVVSSLVKPMESRGQRGPAGHGC